MIAVTKPDNRIGDEAPPLPLDQVLHGDCIEVLQGLPDNSIDACVVDPPYGLGEVKDIAGLLNAWLRDEDDSPYIGKSGFMGKEWDAGVPSPRYWREVYRVLKPGAHILCFAGTRTLDLMALSLRLSGFQYRETLMWLYGSGFPKSTDISKQIDKQANVKREVVGKRTNGNHGGGAKTYDDDNFVWPKEFNITMPATPEAQQWQGWGSALKPAWEPILLFRKPLDGTLAHNTLKWDVGGLNIDATRVGTTDYTGRPSGQSVNAYEWSNKPNPMYGQTTGGNLLGRFPSNLLLSHSIFCVPKGTKRVRSDGHWTHKREIGDGNIYHGGGREDVDFGSVSPEEVEAYDCHESCPILQIDLQSGVRKNGFMKPGQVRNASLGKGGYHGDFPDTATLQGTYGDQGGASRYFQRFPVDEPDFIPFKYAPKASRSERNQGCEGLPKQQAGVLDHRPSGDFHTRLGDGPTKPAANSHPTVKPLQLVSWLSKLICPPGGVILDMFGGSGTTGVSAVQNGFHFVLIEQDASYVEMARARISHAMRHTKSELWEGL